MSPAPSNDPLDDLSDDLSDDGALVLADRYAPRPVLAEEVIHDGYVWQVRRETVDLGAEAGTVTREIIHHPGAVTVLALDEHDRVLMLRQYRHPVRSELWEVPAGLLDVAGEDPLTAAKRELWEEADLRAERWEVLADWFNSPGGSDEAVRIFLARDVHEVPVAERHARSEEELDMPSRWVPRAQARDAVLAGKVNNPGAVIGILAACVARDLGWSSLRPADSPWPQHHAFRTTG